MRGAKLLVSGEINPGVPVAHGNDSRQHRGELRIYALGNDKAGSCQIKSALLVVSLLDRGKQFVAQAQVESEFRRHPPIILPKERVNLVVIINIVQVVDTAAITQANQEGSESGTTRKLIAWVVSQTRTEVKRAARCGGLEDGELFGANLGPELERMIAAHPR